MKTVVLLLLLSIVPLSAWQLPSQCKQLVVGTTSSWDSSHLTLTIYQKKGNTWRAITTPVAGRVGRNGLAWGRGIHPFTTKPYLKREGDGRAPAGVFLIGNAFGSHKSIKKNRRLSYTRVTTRDLWVEDSTSPYYNRHLRLNHEPTTSWEKKAQMRQNDYPHSLKLYIGHNTATNKLRAKPHAGSSIFFHIWRNAGKSPTAGCTTIPEKNLRQLISLINPRLTPLYVLLPKSEYQKLRTQWKLP